MRLKSDSTGLPSAMRTDVAKKKRRKKCEQCQQLKPNVNLVVDPYDQDVDGEINYRWLCDFCLQTVSDDI